jgi:hypothetical protein
MTHDEIIEMAEQADFEIEHGMFDTKAVCVDGISITKDLERFAKLVAAKEREACAKVANQISDKYGYGYYGNEVDTADEIAAAIRARGEA